MPNWIVYIWMTVVRIVYLIVIVAIFDRIRNPQTAIIVAVLGLLYCAIKGIGISRGLLMTRILPPMVAFQDAIDELRVVAGLEPKFPRENAALFVTPLQIKLTIESIYLGLVSLLCMLVIWSKTDTGF